MTQHLKRHHNFLPKYKAFKSFEELSALKVERLKIRKCKNEHLEEERPKKNNKNSIAPMISVDATHTNIVIWIYSILLKMCGLSERMDFSILSRQTYFLPW